MQAPAPWVPHQAATGLPGQVPGLCASPWAPRVSSEGLLLEPEGRGFGYLRGQFSI